MPIPIRIMNATRTLGAPPGWDEERNGPCVGLPIRDEEWNGTPVMTSAWEPTAEEIQALQGGAKIELTVIGTGHPPVSLSVVHRSEDGLEKRVPKPLSDVEKAAVALAAQVTSLQNAIIAIDPYSTEGRRVLNEGLAAVANCRRALYAAVEIRVKEVSP